MSSTNDCFNYQNLDKREYMTYFQIVKKMSGLSISELIDKGDEYRFHEIKQDALRGIEYKVKRHLNFPANMPIDELPPIAQFGLYTDPAIEKDGQYISKAPRVIFALSGSGLLNILFLDLHHKTYKKKPVDKSAITKTINTAAKTIKGAKGLTKMLKQNFKKN